MTGPSKARWGAIIGCVALVGASTGARAGNEGIGDFFSRAFGIGTQEPAAAQPPEYGDSLQEDRPLIVRPHHRRPKIAKVEVQKGPYVPVSIYEDRTLRRGDAVMTASGIRIFRGSGTLPYREGDFTALSNADGLSRNVEKALVAIDQVPRS